MKQSGSIRPNAFGATSARTLRPSLQYACTVSIRGSGRTSRGRAVGARAVTPWRVFGGAFSLVGRRGNRATRSGSRDHFAGLVLRPLRHARGANAAAIQGGLVPAFPGWRYPSTRAPIRAVPGPLRSIQNDKPTESPWRNGGLACRIVGGRDASDSVKIPTQSGTTRWFMSTNSSFANGPPMGMQAGLIVAASGGGRFSGQSPGPSVVFSSGSPLRARIEPRSFPLRSMRNDAAHRPCQTRLNKTSGCAQLKAERWT